MPTEAGSRCPACGLEALAEARLATAADPRASRGSYGLARCSSCGTGVTRGRSVADATGLYRGDTYAPPVARAEPLVAPLRRLGEWWVMRALGPLRAGDAVYDVGAGDGRLAARLRERGIRAGGTEPFGGGKPELERLAAADLRERESDVVVLWHVLEHLDDPGAALAGARRVLKPDGRLVLSVPNLDSLQARIGRDRWFHQDVPRHAVHFTRAGLLRLLERSGFAPSFVGTFVLDQNVLGMTQTLLNVATRGRDALYRKLKGQPVSAAELAGTVVAFVPAAAAAVALELAAAAAGRGGSLVVRAVRAAP